MKIHERAKGRKGFNKKYNADFRFSFIEYLNLSQISV